jgi:integrase
MSNKRGNREGSIYQRSDGRWVGQISLPGDSRVRRRRKSVYGRTRADVRRKLVDAQKTIQDGGQIGSDLITVGTYMTSWLDHRRHEIRWQTWRRYEQIFRTHIEPVLGGVRLSKLRPDHLRDLYSAKLEEGLSSTTVKHIHAVLRAALRQAERDEIIVRNVCRQVDPPRAQPYEISPLSPTQSRQLLTAAIGHEDEALYVLALTTGMRQAELLGLRWRDIDFKNGFVSVRKSLVFRSEGWSLDEPKTRGSKRRIHLTSTALGSMLSHKNGQLQHQLKFGPAYQNHDLVFPSQIGTPRRGANVVYRSFRPLMLAAGLPQIRFHDLRHTAATLLLSQSVHPKVVSEMLGHSSVRLTLDTYSHVTPTMQKQATIAMDTILSS